MADAVEDASDAAIPALAEPERRVNWVFLTTITLANIGIMVVLLAPLSNLLPRYAAQITGGPGKEEALAWVSGIGAIAAMVFNPLAGAFSDRTTLRSGRRRSWVLWGCAAGAALMVVMSYQTTIAGLAIVWFLVLAATNSAYAAATAYIPDQVPVRQRGVASGLVGIAAVLGVVLGVGLDSYVVTDLRLGTWVLAGLMILLALPLLVLVHDAPLPRGTAPPLVWSRFFRNFWVSPRKFPDFAWAFITRFLIWLGTALATIYLLYYLTDFLHYPQPDQGQALLVLLYGVGTVATAVVAGRFSDRSGNRRIYVIVSSIVMGLSVLILAFIPTFGAACIGATLLGFGYGVYLAVDQALITQVLPAAADRARDLGVINIANTAPQIIAPMVAAPIVTGLGYPALFTSVTIVMVIAGILVRFIKSVP